MVSPWSVVDSHPPHAPIELRRKGGESVTLSALVEEAVPEARSGYYYANKYYIGSGDLQTVLAGGEFQNEYPVWYGRRFLLQPDGAQFSVDYCLATGKRPENWDEDVKYIPEDMPRLPPSTRILRPEEVELRDAPRERNPILVICHGLTGGSHENYIRHLACELRLAVPDIDIAIITSRGCNRTKITTPRLFNAAWTEDLRQLVQYIARTQPERPIFLSGFSLGASILANYLGQEGSDVPCQVKGTIVVSNPWDLLLCSVHINGNYMGRNVYSKTMTSNLCRLARNNREVLAQDETFVKAEPKLKGLKRMSQFDDLLTGPLFGFLGSSDYYRQASSVNRIGNIRVPTLILAAKDDPVSCDLCVPYKESPHNPYLYLCTTSHGGHLGWFGAQGPRWYTTVMSKFVSAFLDRLDLTQDIPVPPHLDVLPFFRDGRYQVGENSGLVPKKF